MTLRERSTGYYRAHAIQIQTEKEREYETILSVTRRLKRISNDNIVDFPELAAAISENRRLWVAIASAVSSEMNVLSQPVRAGLVYLGEFVGVHSSKVLKGQATIDPLIEVNVSVLKGLAGKAVNS